MTKSHIIHLLFVIFTAFGYSQVSINATVSCPPCRPVEGCGVCWENQQQADQCEEGKINDPSDLESINLIVQNNPIKDGNLSLTSSTELSGKIVILNQLGSVVKTVDLENRKSNYINLILDFESGLYFLVYYDYNKKVKITKKLLFTK